MLAAISTANAADIKATYSPPDHSNNYPGCATCTRTLGHTCPTSGLACGPGYRIRAWPVTPYRLSDRTGWG